MGTRQNPVRPHVLSATMIIGDPVRNADGDDVGEIEELMIDPAQIENAPRLSGLPNLTNSNWDADVVNFWNEH